MLIMLANVNIEILENTVYRTVSQAQLTICRQMRIANSEFFLYFKP